MDEIQNIFLSRLNPVSEQEKTTIASAVPRANQLDSVSDRVTISKNALQFLESSRNNETSEVYRHGGEEEISATELREVQKLQQRDSEVRAHEQMHLAAAGSYAAGGASYTYEAGPDGKRYAVGGEVAIDISREVTPEETLEKMQIVYAAALAPLNPSAADRKIAAQAAAISAQALREIQSLNIHGGKENNEFPAPLPRHVVFRAYQSQSGAVEL